MLCSICNRETNNVTINGAITLCPTCAACLAHAAPALLRGCEQAADLLARLNTPNAPTRAEVVTTLGRLLAVVATARGTAVTVEAVEESWPDTSPGLLMAESAAQPDYDEWLDWETGPAQPATPTGFTFWREMGDPDDWYTWPVSGAEEP